MSHPIWVRGLKLSALGSLVMIPPVAPHMGAWIETAESMITFLSKYVAPHMGAWIETEIASRKI